jgi:hypothetical protein
MMNKSVRIILFANIFFLALNMIATCIVIYYLSFKRMETGERSPIDRDRQSDVLSQILYDRLQLACNGNPDPAEIEADIGMAATFNTIRPGDDGRIRASNLAFDDTNAIHINEYEAVAVWQIPNQINKYFILFWKDGHISIRQGQMLRVG